MKEFLRRRIYQPVMLLLSQGITPAKIAQSLAFGTVLGVFPVLGTTTALVTLAALLWRLNQAATHLVHFVLTPIQLLLIIPFVRVGEHIVGAAPQPLSIAAGLEIIGQGAMHAIDVLWDAIVHAVIGWLAIGPVVLYLLYRILVPVLERAARRYAPQPAAAD